MCGIGVCSRPCTAVVEISGAAIVRIGQEIVYAAARLSIWAEGGLPENSRKAVGSRQMTVVPRPAAESIVTAPPCRSMRLLTSDRPSPAPDRGVPRSNFLNIRA